MYSEKFFDHTDPHGVTLQDRVAKGGYLSCPVLKVLNENVYVGENLARGINTAEEVFDAWMKSVKHRRILINGLLTETGIGEAGGYWVQIFASSACSERANQNSLQVNACEEGVILLHTAQLRQGDVQ